MLLPHLLVERVPVVQLLLDAIGAAVVVKLDLRRANSTESKPQALGTPNRSEGYLIDVTRYIKCHAIQRFTQERRSTAGYTPTQCSCKMNRGMRKAC